MSSGRGLQVRQPTREELYDEAPCGYLAMLLDGTVVAGNQTLLRSLGHEADAVVGLPFDALLTTASQLYFHTHWRPQLDLRGEAREVPADLVRADGSRLSVLINARVARAGAGEAPTVRMSIFDATDRRRYERELLAARDDERRRREAAEAFQRFVVALADAPAPQEVATTALAEVAGHVGADVGELTHGGSALGRLGGEAPRPDGDLVLPLALADGSRAELRFAAPAALPTSADARRYLDALVEQVAQALGRALAHSEALGRSEQQAAIAALGARALRCHDVDEVGREAVRQVRRLLDARSVTIERDDEVVAAAGVPQDAHDLAVAHSIGSGPDAYGVLRVLVAPGRCLSVGDRDFVVAIANVVRHAADRIRHAALIGHQATHDALTGLANRVLLNDRLDHEIARARRASSTFAMCLLDVDDFKLVNDTLGHHVGDELLRMVGDRLVGAVRATDLVARLGGDEFVVLQRGPAPADGGAALAARICRALEEPFVHREAQFTVRSSVGAVVGDGRSSREELLRDADIAMYQAKGEHRGQHVVFDRSMRELVRRRLEVEQELRVALREGQLRVHYQPVFDAASRGLVGFEALVRWEHPERGLVPPGEFIGVAEASGLVVDLGRHVLRTACEQLATWRRAGLVEDHVTMSVNVSGRQLVRTDVAEDVTHALRSAGLDATPWLVGLEITESVLMETGGAPAEVLDDLAGLGVRLLLDDFGTGASSLARLKRFPVDTLKIDRAFIAGIAPPADEEDRAIVAAIIAMAGALGQRVVAEGVEREEQATALQELGCDDLQGFLLGRPVAPGDLTVLGRQPPAGSGSGARLVPAVPLTPSTSRRPSPPG